MASATPLRARTSTCDRLQRARANGHPGGVLWFTGLPGAGKTTLARILESNLFASGYQVIVIDGDDLRRGLSKDLGFSPGDRAENVRRAACLAKMLAEAGLIVIVAMISPFERDRQCARQIVGEGFHLVYVDATLGTCESRDPKGLYRSARRGYVSAFTGVDSPFEPPFDVGLTLDTTNDGVWECSSQLMRYAEVMFVADGARGNLHG